MRVVRGDVVIVGAGFAGSLTALILKQIGLQPILIEKSSHPRFSIGESSTPLANLFLEKICKAYRLNRIAPLCKFGSWQKNYPQIACGLKRGSSFFKHEKNLPFQPDRRHSREMLVAASPNDQVGDTQWFRADFDHFMAQEAIKSGVFYSDKTTIHEVKKCANDWRLSCEKDGKSLGFEAEWLIDASGGAAVVSSEIFPENLSVIPAQAGIQTTAPQSWIPASAGMTEAALSSKKEKPAPASGSSRQRGYDMKTNSWTIFSHFKNVRSWRDVLSEKNAFLEDYPFHPDDAALHHVFDEGWMWVLRFNNGVTSAGFVLNGEKYAPTYPENPNKEWAHLLARYPSIAEQFAQSEAIRPFTMTGRLERKLPQSFGDGWVALPAAAYFLDPFFSPGNAHTLLGVLRLADAFQNDWQTPKFLEALEKYDHQLQREIEFVDWLIHGSYLAFSNFDLLAAFSMYYYTGSIFSEHRYKSGAADLNDEFLFSHDRDFRAEVKNGYKRLLELTSRSKPTKSDLRDFYESVVVDIAPWNLAGLCGVGKKNMYPYG